ncbi:MAG: primosomal protein N' [Deltaproteobacteria bacterium]|nr:primosomal protein N' [Deltaproteobacteria bacterium]
MTERTPPPPDASGASLVEVAPLGVPLGALTYRVPEGVPDPRPGTHVVVPVGGRRLAGIVLGPASPIPGRSLKALSAIHDGREPLAADVLRLARWTASYYLAPLGEVLRLSLAPEVGRVVEARYAITEVGRAQLGELALEPGSRAVLEALAGARSATRRGLARGDGEHRRALPEILRKLERAGAIERLAAAAPQRHRARRSYVPARDVGDDELAGLARRSPKLSAVWSRVVALGRAEVTDLADLGAAPGVAARLERLVARGWLSREEYFAGAGDQHVLAPSSSVRHTLNPEQRAAVLAVTEARARGSEASPIALLGVTGSGKTEVYLAAVEEALAHDLSALVLVPEIALTPLAVGRFRQRFGALVGVLHSGLGDAERAAEWSRALSGESRVLIGTRLAIFAPVPKLGLIVVDEEHDSSYKQDGGVRYHARDIAVVRAQMTGCPVVLGSATPSVETYWNARSGRYRLIELTARPGAAMLPTIEVVDLRRAENRTPGSSRLSAPVVEALARNAERGEQSLLFLNRRGWAPIVVCESCGDRPGCPRCSVSLALHRRPPRLVCHYCGTEREIPERCSRCGAQDLRRLGAGTQRIEDELGALLPDLRIERLDRDSVASAGKRTRVLERVASRAVDVLIGTQMVAKGTTSRT